MYVSVKLLAHHTVKSCNCIKQELKRPGRVIPQLETQTCHDFILEVLSVDIVFF